MSTTPKPIKVKVSRRPLFQPINEEELKNVVFVSDEGRLNQVRSNDIKRWLKKTGKKPEQLFNKTRYGEYFVGPLKHLRNTLPERNSYNPTVNNSMRLIRTIKKNNKPYNLRYYEVKNHKLNTPEKYERVLVRYPKENSNSYEPFSLVKNTNYNHPNKEQKRRSHLQKLLKKMHKPTNPTHALMRHNTTKKPTLKNIFGKNARFRLGKKSKSKKRKSKKSGKKHSKK